MILTAVASCLNSALYTASRMAYSLSARGDAPASWSRVTSRGVPSVAIMVSTAVGFLGVVGNYVLPGQIFGYLLATSGAIALFVYLVIALSQLRMRRELDAAGVKPAVRMWAFPALTYLTIVFIAVVLLMMAVLPGQRLELWFSIALAAVIVAIAVAKHRVGPDVMIRRPSAQTALTLRAPKRPCLAQTGAASGEASGKARAYGTRRIRNTCRHTGGWGP